MTFSYRDQLEMIKGIHLAEGERKTLDCPFCGGRRKFSITKQDGRLLWNCFRASCTAKGSYQGQRSVQAMKTKLSGSLPPAPAKRITPLPKITTSIFNHDPALQYVISNNCMDAYNSGYINIRYAPAEKRVLFYTADGQGAVGRSITGRTPKWWTYGDVTSGFEIGVGQTYVYVEDVPSACSVARLCGYVGVPLLGTSIRSINRTDPLTSPINGTYNNLCVSSRQSIVILDNDASSKAMSLARSIGEGATVRLTRIDLKALSPDAIKAILEPV